MNLTDKEKRALMAIAENGMNQMGGKEPKSLHNDNFSWFNIADMMAFTEFSKNQCAGLISSLEDKGLIADDGGKDGLYLSEAGIDEAQIIFDAANLNPKTEKEITMNKLATINGIAITDEASLDQFSNKELAAKYNEIQIANNLPQLVKFSDRKSAIRRTFAAIEAALVAENEAAPDFTGVETIEDVCLDCNAPLNAAGECDDCNKLFEDSKPVIKPEPVAVAAVTPRVKGSKALTTEIFDAFYDKLTKKECIAKCVEAGLKQSSSEAFYSDYKKAHPTVVA